ncbi:aminopeptidase N [Anderseniella sp. Alg231-50]|uniref:aminopeptidase N n=1 Tax=Anderseniella sp. Alg231-50 TaxID=1922226 RepID=UPI000D54F1C8
MRTETPPTIRLKDYKPSDYLIDHVSLDVALQPTATGVVSILKMRPNPASRTVNAPVRLDGEALELKSVAINGETIGDNRYTLTENQLIIDDVPEGQFELTIETQCNPDANTALSGLYRSNDVYCTQCEAEGFRRITYFLDRPDVLATYQVRVEADRDTVPVLLANGNPVETGELADGRHFAVWQDPWPKPSYLFALVAGDLACVTDHFTTVSGRKVELRIYVEQGKQDRCDWAMQSLKASMAWDETAFGREYDLDIFMIVAVSDFNMGAMENKGLNVFNDKYILARADTATDQDYVNIEAIIAHEYFHNWTGNRITCRDWFQLCLKEGLTVFRDQEFTSDMRSRAVKRIQDVRTLRSHQFPEDAGPLAHPVRPQSYIEINNFYTATVYEKGAEVVRMFKTLLGAEKFAKALNIYFDRHDGDAATVEDFVTCMEEASGRDLAQFFNWYNHAGTPSVNTRLDWDQAAATATLTVSQSLSATPGQSEKPDMHIPLATGLIGPDGADMELVLSDGQRIDSGILELRSAKQSWTFSGITDRPVLSINRGFSSPVNLTTGQRDEDLLFLMANDHDAFNRWEAGQTLSRSIIMSAMQAIKDGDEPDVIDDYADALASVLASQELEPAFKAQMLALPSEADIANMQGRNVNPDLIQSARDQVRKAVGGRLAEQLESLAGDLPAGDYSPSATAAGQRALAYAALSLLGAAEPAKTAAAALSRFEAARHMSDMMGPLNMLAGLDVAERDQALDMFHQRFTDDHLIVDKWFSLHAMRKGPDAAAHIRALMQHDDFSITRPNRVRALIGTFAGMNQTGFNSASGDGYDVLAEVVMALDERNPQVAARMVSAFRSYQLMDRVRQDKARTALGLIRDKQNLSADTLEMVSRMLD